MTMDNYVNKITSSLTTRVNTPGKRSSGNFNFKSVQPSGAGTLMSKAVETLA